MTIKKKINMAALIAPAGGMGSHLVLHKMHGHHKIMAQQEIIQKSFLVEQPY